MTTVSRRRLLGGAGTVLVGAGLAPARAVPNTTTRLKADVCVVGAGFAGLAAAWRLKQAGARVVVLEASNRVGGRSSTVNLADGTFVDWGGQWVGPTQDRFYALIKEMGAEAGDRIRYLESLRLPIGVGDRTGMTPIAPPYENAYWRVPESEIALNGGYPPGFKQ